MTRIIFSFLSGFIASMVGDKVISYLFPLPHHSNERRLDFLTRCAFGVASMSPGHYMWLKRYSKKMELREAFFTSFIINAIIFGLAVLGGGMVRGLGDKE